MTNLRKDLLIVLAARDAKFALDALLALDAKMPKAAAFLKTIKRSNSNSPQKLPKPIRNKPTNSPKRIWKTGFGPNVFAALESLHKKDPEIGAKFAQDILSKIKGKDSR